MRKFRRYVGVPLLAGCAAVAGCAPDPAAPPDLATQLEQDTGTPWTVYTDPRSHEVRFLAPKTPVQIGAGTPEEKARAFFDRYRDHLHTSGKADEIHIVSSATDARGGIHIRFAHVLPGTDLPVFAAGSTAHFTQDGSVYWLQTDFRADLADVDGIASVTKDEATAKALAYVKVACGAVKGQPTATAAQLGVLSDPDTHAALAYRVRVELQSESCGAPAVFVDAKSGAPLKIEEGAHRVDTPKVGGSRFHRLADTKDTKPLSVRFTGTSAAPKYEMITDEEPSTRVITRAFPEMVIETTDPRLWDASSPARGAAVDAHFFTREALRFLRPFAGAYQAHGRGFAEPLGLDVNVYVHDMSAHTYNGTNAFAIFDEVRGMDVVRFGDSYPGETNALPWSAAYDIVAHEVTHLITDHTSGLKYEKESGALSESFSDVMGAAAEHARAPNDAKNFSIGEDMFVAGVTARATLRSMSAPQSVDGNPDHATLKKPCSTAGPTDANDHCFVHENSGIPNRAFSLTVTGGSLYKFARDTPPELRPVGVPSGIGWEKATQIVYWAATGLSATASFENAALAQIAESLVVGGLPAAHIVGCAWYAVGVYKPAAVGLDRAVLDAYCKPPATLAEAPGAPSAPSAGSICSGRGSSLVCDPALPAQAIRCANGALPEGAESELCADLAQRCKPVSASDPTAVMDANGVVCE